MLIDLESVNISLMSKEFSELAPREDSWGTSYLFKDRSAFGHEKWVPTLSDVYSAKTIGQQKDTLGFAIANVAAYYTGLREISRNRLEYHSHPLKARFKFTPEQNPAPQLTYVTIGKVARIGYQTPDQATPNPAFAVIDIPGEDYRRIVRSHAEKLSDAERIVTTEVVQALAQDLDYIYPDLEIYQKLATELPNIS